MKNVILFSFFYLTSNLLFSQSNYCATPSRTLTVNQSSAGQATNCVQLLNDLIPTANDRTIEVNVCFWVFAPTYTSSSTSAWLNTNTPTSATTYSDAEQCIRDANSTFTNMPSVPQLTMPSVASLTDAKIRLTIKSFSIVYNDLPYLSVGTAATGTWGPQWNDPTAINIFLGTETKTAIATNTVASPNYTYISSTVLSDNIGANGVPGIYPNNIIYFNPSNYRISSPQIHDNIRNYGRVLAHEVSHILGLDHPTAAGSSTCCPGDPLSAISPTIKCCTYVEATDYAMEQYVCSTANPCGPLITQHTCNTTGQSDNLMSQNAGCNRYLSPQQIAVMHYNLRTILSSFLSTSGYTAATMVNNNLNYFVTSDETWTTDRYFKGSIIVNTNKTLIIKCGVAMTHDAQILVQPGGQLIIDGGTVTNISGRLWRGISLQGSAYFSRVTTNPNNSGALLYQGIVRFKNNATISQALVGVRNHTGGANNSGGVIFAQNSNFINNQKDVELLGSYGTGAITTNPSWFYNCNFKTTGAIGTNVSPSTHVSILNTNGMTFKGCVFQYTANLLSNHGDGITSTDASYVVDQTGATPCVFENLDKGILVNNINPLKGVPTIKNCKFIENRNYAGYFLNANYLAFHSNTVQLGQISNSEGLYLNTCKYYTIKGNSFSQINAYSAPGINVYNSLDGAHQIYLNTFSHLFMGINSMGINNLATNDYDGLLINCNKFNLTSNLYDVVLSHTASLSPPTVRKFQGANNTNPPPTTLVRNIYGAVCGNNQNKWHMASVTTQTIIHGSNSNSLAAVTQPTANNCKHNNLQVFDKGIPLNFANHCPYYPPSSGGSSTVQSQKLTSLREYIYSLESENNNGQHFSEIQTAESTRLNIFLTDTLGSQYDSIYDLLDRNRSSMKDAEIQVIFTLMAKGDYSTAQIRVDSLNTSESNWASILTKLIALEQDTVDGIYGLNTNSTDRNFFINIANNDSMPGTALAKALLKLVCDSNYTEPHALPEGEEGARLTEAVFIAEAQTEIPTTLIEIFPTPVQDKLFINYNSTERQTVKLDISDLSGRHIYTNYLIGPFKDYVSLVDFENGLYLLTISSETGVVTKFKVIKKD